MTEKEFNKLRMKVLTKMGTVYKALATMNSKKEGITQSLLEDIVNNAGLSMEELNLMGYEYNEDSMTFEHVRIVTFEDIEEQEQQEEVKAVSIVDNRTSLSTMPPNVDLEQFQGLMNNYSTLMEMIERYKQNSMELGSDNKSIVIELPLEDEKQFKKTFRINKVIFEQFEEFCNQHSEYTVKDLVSMALKEYMERHS
ncbi:hypothetical protein [Clostridium culturomicium]|uniref:hypothetical protein n=1 Tax=Clostridium culturomicium TaxID=1499683 RepID=UPI003857E7C6